VNTNFFDKKIYSVTTMGKISLEGMTFFARHGYYEEEQILGNEFIVDIYVETNLVPAAMRDELLATVNYENIYFIAQYEMSQPSKLLEHVCARIASQVRAKAGGMLQSVNVVIRKKNPPLGGRVQFSVVESSGRIGLEGMEFFAPIGASEEGVAVANEVLANVYVRTDLKAASQTDNLEDTLNYEAIFWATKTEIDEPAQVLENVAYRIADNLKRKYSNLQVVEIQLRRKNPPLRGKVPEASIEMSFSHTSSCPRCRSKMLCYQDENCWCNNYKVLPATQRMLEIQFGDCLCENCVSEFGIKLK
jgi:dihydroneopterin aldolase